MSFWGSSAHTHHSDHTHHCRLPCAATPKPRPSVKGQTVDAQGVKSCPPPPGAASVQWEPVGDSAGVRDVRNHGWRRRSPRFSILPFLVESATEGR